MSKLLGLDGLIRETEKLSGDSGGGDSKPKGGSGFGGGPHGGSGAGGDKPGGGSKPKFSGFKGKAKRPVKQQPKPAPKPKGKGGK